MGLTAISSMGHREADVRLREPLSLFQQHENKPSLMNVCTFSIDNLHLAPKKQRTYKTAPKIHHLLLFINTL